jgi:hypothetical protein
MHRTEFLLDELEELNLAEVDRAPDDLGRRLALLIESLPFPYVPTVGPGPSPTDLMDELFEIQLRLMQLKNPLLAGELRDRTDGGASAVVDGGWLALQASLSMGRDRTARSA